MRAVLLAAVLLSACATAAAPVAEQTQALAAAPSARTSHPMFSQPGYLAPAAVPDFIALMGPPPEANSAAMERDEQTRTAALRLRNTPRFTQAATDADLRAPNVPGIIYSCAANVNISPETTPRLSALMMRTAVDFGRASSAIKARYQRTRPFVQHNANSCSPADEAQLRQDGSYPSGHSAIGWGWALVLAELLPDRANEILQRGRDFGQSRVVCDVHWQSDVEGGRTVAAAVNARLHADPTFRADLDAARAELAASHPPAPDTQTCTAEAAALRAN